MRCLRTVALTLAKLVPGSGSVVGSGEGVPAGAIRADKGGSLRTQVYGVDLR